MYIHLGGDVVVNQKDIIGIFNLETASIAKDTREYLKAVEQKGYVVNVSDELPASFVVCRTKAGTRVYITQISSATLFKRANYIKSIMIK